MKNIFLLLPAFFAMSCGHRQDDSKSMASNRVNAPELTAPSGWLNTDKPYTIKELRGKVVLLDFWTYGCINCQHIIPDLKRLEKEYPNELVVIGVHSAKFNTEKSSENIKKAILKYGITHPVINDANSSIWDSYAIKSWPTVVVIDPNGKVVGQKSGEGVYAVVKPAIDSLLEQFKDKINREPLHFRQETMAKSLLRFPAKLAMDAEGSLYVTDAGNNRVLKLDTQGKILDVIGSGEAGLKDGDLKTAAFNSPQGLFVSGNALFVADTRNHAIRKIDLAGKTVETFLGNGRQSGDFQQQVKKGDPLNSPWDVWADGNDLYIAMAGDHQVWKADIAAGTAKVYAGNGYEALSDGALREASFSQPSGLFKAGTVLYVADPEASAIRTIDIRKGTVRTVLGSGLFDFGDVDGGLDKARIQHAVGLAVRDNLVYIADTYNGKIKTFDLRTHMLATLTAGLEEPNGLLLSGNTLWITNTNRNELVALNLNTKEKHVLSLK